MPAKPDQKNIITFLCKACGFEPRVSKVCSCDPGTGKHLHSTAALLWKGHAEKQIRIPTLHQEGRKRRGTPSPGREPPVVLLRDRGSP